MFRDALLRVWAAVALTADDVSTNSIDLGAELPEVGAGEELGFALSVDVAADHTSGNETYQFNLLQDAAADLGTADILASFPFSYADLKAGDVHFLPIPPGSVTKRYLGLGYDGGGTTPTITVTAVLTSRNLFALAKPKNYAKKYVV